MATPIETPPGQNPFSLILKIILLFAMLAVVMIFYFLVKTKTRISLPLISSPTPAAKAKDFKKFSSEQEFLDFLKRGGEEENLYFGFGGANLRTMDLQMTAPEQAPGALKAPEGMGAGPERVSETNVQVKGIDEPDIVKTDGREIYFSSDRYYYPRMDLPVMVENSSEFIPPRLELKTKTIKAFPPDQLTQDGEINKTGNLLLENHLLVIFTQAGENKIYGYDVSDPKNPQEKWQIELKNPDQLVSARLYQSKIYFVTQTQINRSRPCPITPLTVGGAEFSVRCTDIYYPDVALPVNVTFNAFILNPLNGQIEKNLSFVGSSGQSVIYMSPNALYTTYSYYHNPLDFIYQFFQEKGQDLLPAETLQRLDKIRGYDLSHQAKMVEWQQILQEHLNSLSDDDRLKFENEMQNRLSKYTQEHLRELQKTGIVKISLADFNVRATGDIPGEPLNQFSLDEWQGNLRVATTVGGRLFMMNLNPESANDLYVLNDQLNLLGSIKDLGLTERIYSVRFVADKGYLVTFRETDPFYVLDLSAPKNPKVSGELKIPGFSSYLHPLTDNLVLGVGRDQNKVKLSLFDVSDPARPKEISKYLLDDSWTDVQNTHHAFLQDDKHQIFFLPGSRGGYIFSYDNNDLSLKKAVSNLQASRAIYIDNYLYIIADNKIVVFDETNWEERNSLDL